MHRRIAPARRIVSYSRQFVCPPEHVAGMKTVEQKIQTGEDLQPHLSRKLKDQDYNDDALNDFGIHHLHLGTVIEGDGFSKRSGPILFALFRPEQAYLLQVFTHGDFSNREVVEIVHDNWPQVIFRYRVPVIDLAFHADSTDVKDLRKGHVNTSLKMNDGTIYMPLGGGMMSNGTGLQVTLQRDRALDIVMDAEENFRNQEGTIASLLAERGWSDDQEPEFKLEPDERGLNAFCEQFGLRIRLIAWPSKSAPAPAAVSSLS
jgi:hypothetical protein